jgi:hypothetical protein
LQQRLRKQIATKKGRARLRQRVGIEHNLAHLVRRQGRRARYLGVRPGRARLNCNNLSGKDLQKVILIPA